MNPELEEGRGWQLDEKIAVSVALALGIPLVLLLFWLRGFFPWVPSERSSFPPLLPGSRTETASQVAVATGGEKQGRARDNAPDAASKPSREGQQENPAPPGKRLQGAETGRDQAARRFAEPETRLKSGAAKAEWESLTADHERLRRENETLQRATVELRQEFAGAKLLYARSIRDSQKRDEQQNDQIAALQAALEQSRANSSSLGAEVERLRSETALLRQREEDLKKLQSALDAEKKRGRDLEEASKRSQEALADLKTQMAAAAKNPMPVEKDASSEAVEATTRPAPGTATPDGISPAERERLQTLELENRRLRDALKAASGGKAPIRARVIESRPAENQLPSEVRKPDELWEGAAPLNDFLRRAAKDGLGIPQRDELARSQHLGQLVARVHFENGRYAVAPPEAVKLESLLSQEGEGGYFLVMGYASLSGCNQQNETLSRRRAEAVAAVARRHLKPGARLQTMYFGETDQFDSGREEKNRVVEVWRVSP